MKGMTNDLKRELLVNTRAATHNAAQLKGSSAKPSLRDAMGIREDFQHLFHHSYIARRVRPKVKP